jgi:methyl-accepting chemotaxis protein
MKIRGKITSLVAVPVIGLAIFVIIGTVMLVKTSKQMNSATNDTFAPIIKEKLPLMNSLHRSIAQILNSDRDAYQGFLAEVQSVNENDSQKLNKLNNDSIENMQQVSERMNKASESFSPAMQSLYSQFKNQLAQWNTSSRKIVQQSMALNREYLRRNQLSVSCAKQFELMRKTLDEITGMIEEKISSLPSGQEKEKLFNALALILNADRDAYQAYLAQLYSINATTEKSLIFQQKENKANIDQVKKRVETASAVFDSSMKTKYQEFVKYREAWEQQTREIVGISVENYKLQQLRASLMEKSTTEFQTMRSSIDKLDNHLEDYITSTEKDVTAVSTNAFKIIEELGDNISALITSFIVIGLIISIASLLTAVMFIGTITRPVVQAANIATMVSLGDFSQQLKLDRKDEIGELAQAIDKIPATMEEMNKEFTSLAGAADNGDLQYRGDEKKFSGAYRNIIHTMNTVQDKISAPVQEALDVLVKLEVNDISGKVNESNLKGDYLKIAKAVNGVRDRLAHIQETVINISRGDLSDLPGYKQIGKRCDNDKLIPAFITMLESLSKLINDVNSLAHDGLAGKLDNRADASSHHGAYKEIISGVNALMQAVSTPLTEVGKALSKMAHGDFTSKVSGNYSGEFLKLKENINTSITNIDQALSEVTEAVSQVNSGSIQISDASQSLSQGATEQAASLEEISSSLTEMGSQTSSNAANSVKASELSSSTQKAAETGLEQMKKMVLAMHEINASSQEIAKVNKVIDDISFQINLLALNAAVESARAGIHGKGFAVVAGEVRNLAGRSAKAVQETSTIIQSSLEKVKNGLNIAEGTSSAFEKIVSDISMVSEISGNIAEASSQQAEGISQISEGLNQVDQVTQNNTAHAEETAAAAEELSGQASVLQGLMHNFKVSGSRGAVLTGGESNRERFQPLSPDEIVSFDDEEFDKF